MVLAESSKGWVNLASPKSRIFKARDPSPPHVSRFQIAMDNSSMMRHAESIGKLQGVMIASGTRNPPRGISSPSVLPITHSITIRSLPPDETTSWMVMILGWLSAEAACASWKKRCRLLESLPRSAPAL